MKNILAICVVTIILLLSSGCLGNTEDVLQTGTWRLVQLDPSVNVVEFNFNSNGTVIFKDLNAAIIDTGTYTATAEIDHRYLDIKGLQDVPGQYPLNYNHKWTIVRCDPEALIIAVSVDGLGVVQRDFTNI
ncbi:MAG: hypothetical protein N2167_01765 [Flavobacteriales bacterium]|nr:hypothetical protein [Flavobacteriales bacterium]